jgi:hypothetical protein
LASRPEPNGLERDILRTLCYFDVFNYPLKPGEVFHFLPSNSVAEAEVRSRLRELAARQRVGSSRNYFFLPHREQTIVDRRIRAEKRARQLLKRVRHVGKLIRMFPYVRGIAITGDLSKGVATRSSDFDFMIVTEPNRVWICRAMMTAFKKAVLLNWNRYFCINFIVSSDALALEQRSYYTANEIVTTLGLWNPDVFDAFRSANSWTTSFLPNWKNHSVTLTPLNGGSRVQKAWESILKYLPLDRIDHHIMRWFQKLWRRRYRHISDRVDDIFMSTRGISARFTADHERRITQAYHDRAERMEVGP